MKKEKTKLAIPESLQVHYFESYIEIVRVWRSWTTPLLAIFTVFWNGLLVYWYSILNEDSPFIVILFPFLHVAAGISLAYYVVAVWLNKTHIYVDAEKIKVRHKPIPWRGNKEIPTSFIKRLYAKENIFHSAEGQSISYEIHVITRNGKNIKLVERLDSSEQAFYLEHEIKKILNMEAAPPMKGELNNSS
ncbi:hypothetical protein [Nitrosococcus watsonii]|uniref:Uncharacterized protein n=1 Tax=Nitrosococcus watsoni (strain C-113) TaxID=105559 RepID=D8KBG4_NITWC|nr:hypothetical protein [Nitrosococcus watsonii]ADJ29611.1 conserved hypothetical protein [Nitrosococcus watsonii C-113]